jgi:hypothetical protein
MKIVKDSVVVAESKTKQHGEDATTLMQKEERITGQVETMTYVKYLKAAGGVMWAPFLILLLVLAQTAQGNLKTQ